jgi:hypothetical protein
MSAASSYWNLIMIDARGGCKREEIPDAKAFFSEQFPEFVSRSTVPDLVVQRQLLTWVRGEDLDGNPAKQTLAQLCLRCYISKQIEQACLQLEAKFGHTHGFSRYDLFPLVLTDVVTRNRRVSSSHSSLTTEILRTFNPDRSRLATWTNRLVKHHRELKAFLLEQGVYLVSDWAILNDTTPEQLARIFAEFHQLTEVEIQGARSLLESYHAVYRRDRLAAPRTGIQAQCSLPTTEQLEEIAQRFHSKTNAVLPPSEVRQRLQAMAELLRQYRLCVRRGRLPTESLDDPKFRRESQVQICERYAETDESEKLKLEFLSFYNQQVIHCLDWALQQVISERLAYLKRKKNDKSQQFISALQLFHCQGKAMSDIAPIVGLQAQYQVSRLLKLKELRADVSQKMLKALLDSILEQVQSLTESECSPTLDAKQIEVALDEEITKIIHEAEIESEVNSNRNKPFQSLFSRRLCHLLNQDFWRLGLK